MKSYVPLISLVFVIVVLLYHHKVSLKDLRYLSSPCLPEVFKVLVCGQGGGTGDLYITKKARVSDSR